MTRIITSQQTSSQVVGLLAVVLAMLFLCSCNTTEGFGKDVKSLGNGIEQSAQDAKD